jgi:DNA-binding GntR family transcriptional regulator
MNRTLALNATVIDPDDVVSPSLVDGAYAALKNAIRDNVFPPGHRATEADVARQLGMSRTPVHEAIIRLQAEGLVQVLSRRGILICSISADDINEIYEVLIAVEGMAAALLAKLPETARINAVKVLDEETSNMEKSLKQGNLLDWATADERFHTLLTELCGNQRLARISATVRDQSNRARLYTLHLRQTPTDSAAEHHRITNAILKGETDKAENFARGHRLKARDSLVPLIRQFGMKNL